jgi:hypothetical protein
VARRVPVAVRDRVAPVRVVRAAAAGQAAVATAAGDRV